MSDKRKEFTQILLELAKSQTFLSEPKERSSFYLKFEKLYYEGDDVYFRHFYTDIFQVLMQLQRENTLGSMETLALNLSVLKENYQIKNTDNNGKFIDISTCLKKLNDHVSLEMARFNYFEQQYNKTTQVSSINELNAKVDDLKNFSDKYYPKIDKLKRKLHSVQQEYVAILGVFAAIILAFVGGITFSNSVLQNLGNVSIFRLLLTIDLLGLILINTIKLLLNFICYILDKENKAFFAIKWLNIICLIFAGLVLVAWAFNLDKLSNYLGNLFAK